ncbi:ABC transporter permease [Halodesulfovibrio sp.]|jgi:lipopolysaccharide transport system permease protein|uniref:ABC transporter permease n=1 Tax=Halodesulfovibrio sp. TaxID=1912772 RepID=UPI0025FC3F56|nr:ABC transporter permease [Halodesulfovibrio sp.]MCT4625435.1 ABC transporter permease [Halodesulfovibrio sp.]
MTYSHALVYAFVKATAELKAEHERYWLGFVWWLFEPLLQLITLYVLFGLFLQRGGEGFVPFLLVGITCWKGISSLILHAAPSVMQHRNILLQTSLAEWVFPIAAVIADGVKIAGVFVVLCATIALYAGMTLWWATLPLLLLVLLVFGTGLGLLLAAIMPLIPDLRFVVESLLQVGFWAAGVFFSAKELPESLQVVFYMNPAACLLENFRTIMLTGAAPNLLFVTYPLVVGVTCGALGIWLMQRLRGEYVKL